MDVAERISRENVRRLISDAQVDFGRCDTIDDFSIAYDTHLGPDSELAQVRRALGWLEDTKDEL